MLDFTSSLYLGFTHASGSLPPWRQLTTGRPAALGDPPGATTVAAQLARLIGTERAILAPSTLHLFWDWFGTDAVRSRTVFLDDSAYPIARWGVERATARGVPVHEFSHHDPDALLQALKRHGRRSRPPLVVCDGLCPGCGGPAPLPEYLEIAQSYGGSLLIDDTQAMGILGERPGPGAPYGFGGGGSLKWHHMTGPDVLAISSLAKGFGVPVAVLAGGRDALRRFTAVSDTRVHCSPPSAAMVQATAHALALNHVNGDALRRRLTELVRRFRTRASKIGLPALGGIFPVQTLSAGCTSAHALHDRLAERGIRTVLNRERNGAGVRIRLLLTARHTEADVDALVNALKTR